MLDEIGSAFDPGGGEFMIKLASNVKIQWRVGMAVGGPVHVEVAKLLVFDAPGALRCSIMVVGLLK